MTTCKHRDYIIDQLTNTVAQVDRLMKQHHIRHIPIKQGEQVVGIISERDLRWMRSPALSEIEKIESRVFNDSRLTFSNH